MKGAAVLFQRAHHSENCPKKWLGVDRRPEARAATNTLRKVRVTPGPDLTRFKKRTYDQYR